MSEIYDEVLEHNRIRLLIKRDDLIHPDVSGNKWRKLVHNLEAAREAGHHTLLTFGGAYSNHIQAVASAGKIFGFRTVGVIRGEEHVPLNGVLHRAVQNGMLLRYLDRSTYRRKDEAEVIAAYSAEFGRFYLLPEGGTNCLAVRGCAEIVSEISHSFDYLCCSVGTGGTLAGLVAGLGGRSHAIGFPALKGASFLTDDVQRLLDRCSYPRYKNWSLVTDYHFGGFAKRSPELLEFIDAFGRKHGIALDFVYTGKLMYGLFDLIGRGYFAAGSTVVALHTGGVPSDPVSPPDPASNG